MSFIANHVVQTKSPGAAAAPSSPTSSSIFKPLGNPRDPSPLVIGPQSLPSPVPTPCYLRDLDTFLLPYGDTTWLSRESWAEKQDPALAPPSDFPNHTSSEEKRAGEGQESVTKFPW